MDEINSYCPDGRDDDERDVEDQESACSGLFRARLGTRDSMTRESSWSSSSLATNSLTGFLSFRPLQETDRDVLQDMYEEWFPVVYNDEFYDEVVHQRMVNTGEPLYTCAAIYHQDLPNATGQCYSEKTSLASSTSSFVEIQDNEMEQFDREGEMVASVVAIMLDKTRIGKQTASLLISDESRYTRLFYLMTLGTVVEFRKYGLATILVNKCIEEIVEQDEQCGVLYLHVIVSNKAAIRFYEKLGFYRVKEIKDYYRINGTLHNCYLYARYFNGNRGKWDVYYHLVTRVVSVVWERLSPILKNQQQGR